MNGKGKCRIKVLAIWLVLVMVLMTGCKGGNSSGGGAAPDGTSGGGTLPGGVGAAGQEGAGGESGANIQPIAKGRYLESEFSLPDGVEFVKEMKVLSDGSLAVMDGYQGLYLSKDGGESFEKKETGYPQQLRSDDIWPSFCAIGDDGSLFVEYWYATEDGGDSLIGHYYVDAQGNGKDVELPEDMPFFHQYLLTKDGRLLASGSDAVYEVDMEGCAVRRLFAALDYPSYMKEIGGCVYVATREGLQIYDLAQDKFIEDKVLEDFLLQEDTDVAGVTDTFPLLMEKGDTEDSLYVATKRGLYRHVAGGSVMEELIKGTLSSLGAPNFGLTAMACLGAEHFVICYNASAVKDYHYDADSAAAPENSLTVYSLRENEAIGVAINLFRETHPDILINYEIGMTGEDGVTRQDAVRSLNTALLSGTGPDVIVLDCLPVKSYMEKGILKDLSPVVSELRQSGKLFDNIAGTFEQNGKLYAVPAFFTFPVQVGEETQGVTDLESLADRVEELRQEYPDGNIIGSYSGHQVLLRLYDICGPAFVKEDGTLDQEMLTQYLSQAKRIWDAEKPGVNAEYAAGFQERDEELKKKYGYDIPYYELELQSNSSYRMGLARIIFGFYTYALNDYADDTSLLSSLGCDKPVAMQSGLAKNVFKPSTVLGISQTSANQETAQEFVTSMLEKEVQSQAEDSGIPCNKEALQDAFEKHAPGEELFSTAQGDANGIVLSYTVSQPSKEETAHFFEMIGRLDTPSFADAAVKDVVLEQGILALDGEKSIDEAVDEIINRVQIYLTE